MCVCVWVRARIVHKYVWVEAHIVLKYVWVEAETFYILTRPSTLDQLAMYIISQVYNC